MRSNISWTENPTVPVRRDEVKPGMIVHSSHGYRLLITKVRDDAKVRTDDRHVELVGHLHANPECALRNEIYPAGSTIPVEEDSIPMPELTLADASAAREQARVALEEAKAARDALEPTWKAAIAAVNSRKNELDRIDLALASAKRAHLVVAAMEELGIPTTEPPLVVVPNDSDRALPPVWQLTALSTDGKVGLYVHRSRRSKMYAIRQEHVSQAVRDAHQAIRDAQEERFGLGKRFGYSSDEYKTAERESKAKLKQLNAELSELVGGHVQSIGDKSGSDLYAWESRGRGDFGTGSGALKPLPAPGRGKWRWLKVKEQAELGEVA